MSLVSESENLKAAETVPQLSTADVSDFFALLKPRVMSLVIFTAFVGLMIAPGHIHPVLGFTAILCIGVGAGAAGALNMWYDADIDAKMSRTKNRPVPAGRMAPGEALAFGVTLAVFASVTLGLMVNAFAGLFLAFTIFFYAVVYTIGLKRWTAQNIVIGGAAGAFPPMVGWASVTGGVSIEPFILFLIIFFWTPPHFWALALYRSEDYRRAGVPMLPVVSGDRETRRQILLYTLLLAPIGMAPFVFGFAGPVYATVSIVAGALMLWLAWRIWTCDPADEKPAKQVFGWSIVYLFLLFATLLIEREVSVVLSWLA
jgi:protoheme IX farnesyltransferase